MNWWIRKFKSSGSEEQTVREGWFQVSIRNVLLLAKAKETPHHVWLYDHTSLFKLTIETKMSFKVKMSKTLSNIHTTKSYQTKKKKKNCYRLTLTNLHLLSTCCWKGGVGVALFKHISNIRKKWQRKEIQRRKVIIYKIKHESAICSSLTLYIETENCCNTELCQHFTITTECQHVSIMFTSSTGHVNISP